MKQAIGVLLLAVAVVAVAQTQKNGAGQASDATTQALIDAENHWVDALVKSDVPALDAIFADTYVDTDEHSHRSDKHDVLSVLKSGDLKLDSIKFSDMQVHIYGDAAVVTGSSKQAGRFSGTPARRTRIIFTDTLLSRTGSGERSRRIRQQEAIEYETWRRLGPNPFSFGRLEGQRSFL